MSEFEHTTSIDASADQVWSFISDVSNLPKYLPTTHSAQSQGDERVRVQGEAQGHEYDSDGYFKQDRENYRLEWGADEDYYKGWLELKEDGNSSDMTVHLTFTGAPLTGKGTHPATTPPAKHLIGMTFKRGLSQPWNPLRTLSKGIDPTRRTSPEQLPMMRVSARRF